MYIYCWSIYCLLHDTPNQHVCLSVLEFPGRCGLLCKEFSSRMAYAKDMNPYGWKSKMMLEIIPSVGIIYRHPHGNLDSVKIHMNTVIENIHHEIKYCQGLLITSAISSYSGVIGA